MQWIPAGSAPSDRLQHTYLWAFVEGGKRPVERVDVGVLVEFEEAADGVLLHA